MQLIQSVSDVALPSESEYSGADHSANAPRSASQNSGNKRPLVPIIGQLALATASLLGHNAEAAEPWKVDSGVLIYKEDGSKVLAVEPELNFSKQLDEDNQISLHLVYDSLSGASPNGAMAANRAQTFTSPSAAGASGGGGERERENEDDDDEGGSSGSYTARAGERPLDPSFMDNRYVVAGGWSGKPADKWLASAGGGFSVESDFTSVSMNGAIGREFNQKNTTVSLGVNLEFDYINPHGGAPVGLSRYTDHTTDGAEKTKNVQDVMLSVSQIMNRRWVTRFNLGLSNASGYQSDPYKILTVARDGNLITDATDSSSYVYLFEQRPEQRQKWYTYWQNKVAVFNDDSVDIAWRYMSDDWGIQSNTFDLDYHWQLGHSGWFVEPGVRHYQQTAADFYRPFLQDGVDVDVNGSSLTHHIDYASSDARLAAFHAITTGMKVGYTFETGNEFSLALNRYRQFSDNRTVDVPVGSDLYGQDQFAGTDAWWLQARYSLTW